MHRATQAGQLACKAQRRPPKVNDHSLGNGGVGSRFRGEDGTHYPTSTCSDVLKGPAHAAQTWTAPLAHGCESYPSLRMGSKHTAPHTPPLSYTRATHPLHKARNRHRASLRHLLPHQPTDLHAPQHSLKPGHEGMGRPFSNRRLVGAPPPPRALGFCPVPRSRRACTTKALNA